MFFYQKPVQNITQINNNHLNNKTQNSIWNTNINNLSINQKNQTSSNISANPNPNSNQINQKFIHFMHQQIQISCKFYTQRTNKQIIAQSKQINDLKNLLYKNQQQLKNKQIKIIQLKDLLKGHTNYDNVSRISSQVSKFQSKSISKPKGVKQGCIQLNRKDKQDQSPMRNHSPTPNKKKISITGKDKKELNNTYTQLYTNKIDITKNQSFKFQQSNEILLSKLNDKINFIEKTISKILTQQKQKDLLQIQIQKKIDVLEKGSVKLFGYKIKECQTKLNHFFEAYSTHILRIQGNLEKTIQRLNGSKNSVDLLNSTSKRVRQRSIFDQNNSFFGKDIRQLQQALKPMKQQIDDLNQKTRAFLQKQFKYDNYQLSQLLIQINKIKSQVTDLQLQRQKIYQNLSYSINQNKSLHERLKQVTLSSRQNQNQLQEFLKNKKDFEMFKLYKTQSLQMSHENVGNLSSLSKINSYKSDIRKGSRRVQASNVNNQDNLTNSFKNSDGVQSFHSFGINSRDRIEKKQVNNHQEVVFTNFINNSKLEKSKPLQFINSNQNNYNYQQLSYNSQPKNQKILTPQIKRTKIDYYNQNQANFEQQGQKSKQNGSKITIQTKHQSGGRSRRQSSQDKLNKSKSQPNSQKYVYYQKQGDNYQQAESIESHDQNFTNSQSQQSQNQLYQEQQQEIDYQMEQRLIKVIKNMRVSLPIQVEVDQTRYLKSVSTGMYIVDQNGDGFQLSDFEIHNLIEKGIIFI